MSMTVTCPVCKGTKKIIFWDATLECECVSQCTVCEDGSLVISPMDFESYCRAGLTHLVQGASIQATPLQALPGKPTLGHLWPKALGSIERVGAWLARTFVP